MSFVSADNPIPEELPESYWAFFSFVPKDLPWCDWLYFTLHGYPVPAALAVRATRFGFPLPDNISVFPDPNDLTHRECMGPALRRARWLVVVVSPNSAHDPQIDEHIRAFKKAGGEERIIALVVEGAPPSNSTLYVKSENRDWLPLWLQWRLGRDGRFQPADHCEPLIIDARPGYSSLDDVMTTLISVLLDIPREELELLEALTKDDGEVAKASVVSAREKMAAAAMADFEDDRPPLPGLKSRAGQPVKPEPVRRPGFLLSIGGGLILATIAAVVALRNADKTEPSRTASAPLASEVAQEPAAPSASAIESATPSEFVGGTEQPQNVQPVAMTQPAAGAPPFEKATSDLASEPDANQTSPPREPVDREREIRVALQAITSRAEALLERGMYDEAAAAFEESLESARDLAALPGGGPSAHLLVARLCQTLGALQMRVASDAEARLTLELGIKALGKVKGGKEEIREGSRLKVEMTAVLKRLKSHAAE